MSIYRYTIEIRAGADYVVTQKTKKAGFFAKPSPK
jgi:hypothetical protein